jgi:RHS repeat-associated protein
MRQSQQLDLRAWLSGALRVFAIAALALGAATPRAGAVDFVLPGSFDVSPNGSAAYRIPIDVAPGTAGMVPALTLDYDSAAGNGILGQGWSLGGLPSIGRCPRTQAQDSVRGGVNYDTNDRFCLGGMRLMVINGGTYGADGAEYRTEIDSYAKIVSHGTAGAGPAWFEVHTKAGQIIQLGNTADSRILATGKPTARAWAVNKVADTKGNYFTVTYTVDAPNGTVYPNRIDYTANDAAGLPAYSSVRFAYQSRQDLTPAYQAGSIVRTAQLLSHIYAYARFNNVDTMVTDYRFAYQFAAASTTSQLTSITRCGGDGTTCLQPTTFGWTSGGTATFTLNQTVLNGWQFDTRATNNWYQFSGDWNGDGKTDFAMLGGVTNGGAQLWVFLSNGDGTFTTTETTLGCCVFSTAAVGNWYTFGGDWNADGKSDFALLGGVVNGGSQLWVFTSNGDGTFALSETTYGCCVFQTAAIGNWYTFGGDFNGDGRSDFALLGGGNGPSQLWVFLSNGDSTFSLVERTYDCCVFQTAAVGNWYTFGGDWNGDGKTDFAMLGGVVNGPSQLWVFTSNGDGTFALSETTLGCCVFQTAAIANWYTFGGDWNGDGKTDFAMLGGVVNGASQLWVFMSNGDGTFALSETTLSCCVFQTLAIGNWYTFNGDWNGDGKSDFAMLGGVVNGASQLWVFSSNGDGTFALTETTLGCCVFQTAAIANWYTFTGDWDGDGKTDLLMFGGVGGGQSSQIFTFRANGQATNLMSSITTGLGATTTITYQPLTNAATYGKGSSASYPLVTIQAPMLVAQRVDTSDGIGGTYRTEYYYFQAQFDLSGRGFLGFNIVNVYDRMTGIAKGTQYNQAFPFTGLVYDTATWRNTSWPPPPLILKTMAYTASSTGGVYQVIPISVTESASDWDTTPLPTVTTTYHYDATDACGNAVGGAGNATQIVVATSYGASTATKTTTNCYLPSDTTNWLLGRLTQAKVQSTVPGSASQTRTSTFAYDMGGAAPSGLLTQEVIEPSNPDNGNDATLWRETDYVYDAFGNKQTVTVSGYLAAPRTTRYDYDSVGRFAVTVTSPTPQIGGASGTALVEQRAYDPCFGGMTSLTDANNVTSHWSYDWLGRRITETLPGHPQTVFQYILCPTCLGGGYYIQANATGSPMTWVTFDTLNRKVAEGSEAYDGPSQSDGNLIRAVITYDGFGRVASRSRPQFMDRTSVYATFAYDALGRVTTQTNPDGSTATMAYHGLTTSVTNGLNQTRSATKDLQGQTACVVDGVGAVPACTVGAAGATSYAYDAFGNLTQTTDVAGNTTTMTYDRRGRKIAMNDPDLGTWRYAYDGLDQLLCQADAKGQTAATACPATMATIGTAATVVMTYDQLGRMTQRSEPDLVSGWTYDTALCGGVSGTGKGKLASAGANNGYQRAYTYDSLCRTTQVASTIDQPTPYTLQFSYDANGKPLAVTYPNGLVVRSVYTAKGFLQQVVNDATSLAYWTATIVDAEGRVTLQALGNGVTTAQSFNTNTGRILAIQSGLAASPTAVQNLAYGWDVLGNLTERDDLNQTVGTSYFKETFSYDALNRLVQTKFSGTVAKSYAYDATGNFTSKSDVGSGAANSYHYDETACGNLAGPHALTRIDGTVNGVTNPSFCYDANGNLTTGAARTVAYTSFNLPVSITQGTTVLSWTYDCDHARTTETGPNGTTVYLNPRLDKGVHVEKKVTAAGYTWENDIYAGGQTVAIQFDATHAGGAVSIRYLHKDHLGSTQAITDESGTRVENLSYDPWGKRRNTDGSDDTLNTISSAVSYGFTGQEHLPEVGLIHMNGRIYDPLLGRFMTADPTIASILDGQAYNRYSYLRNNPLNDTDPSGFCGIFSCIAKFFGHVVKEVIKVGDTINPLAKTINKVIATTPVLNQIATLAACYYGGWAGCAAAAAATAYYQGASSGQIGTAGIVAGLSALAFSAVGSETGFHDANLSTVADKPELFLANVAGHAAIGCASAAAQGGSCQSGALSGAAGAAIAPVLGELGRGTWQTVAGTAISAAVGGGAAVLGGGKFENGAMTAAMGYLFNAFGVRSVGDNAEVRLPDNLRDALDALGARIGGTGNADWIQRFQNWQIVVDQSFAAGLVGVTDYATQSTKFFTWHFDSLDTDQRLFAVAHEFGHLLPSNQAVSRGFQDLASGPKPVELDANATARRLLGISKNPQGFEHYGER